MKHLFHTKILTCFAIRTPDKNTFTLLLSCLSCNQGFIDRKIEKIRKCYEISSRLIEKREILDFDDP